MKLSGKACNSVFQGPGSEDASEGPQLRINYCHFTTFNRSVTGCLTTSASSQRSNRETSLYKMVLGTQILKKLVVKF